MVLDIVIVHGLASILSYIILVALRNLCTIAEVHLVGKILNADIAVITDRGLAFFAMLGGDKDDTIGTIGTIDGGSRGILQDFHRFDVARIDVIQ